MIAISPKSDVAITSKKEHEVNITQCSNCEILIKEKEKLTTALEKFTKGSTMLKVILQEQKGYMDRAGIGYNPKPKPQKKTKFASFQINLYYPSSSYSFCNYCNKQGHTQSCCYHRKYGTSNSYKWVPKGTLATKISSDQWSWTNSKGPKQCWVPKCV